MRAQTAEILKINKLISENFQKRQSRLPTLPSAGSFFKNISINDWDLKKFPLPEKFIERKMVPVGWVLEQTGLKGLVVGGAKIADEHGNFIINFNNASQKDVLKIVEIVKEKVYNKFGINLEEEVQIIN
jgi:UDP-N-acetylenolpyruvoylglucosamine reductase